MSETKQFARFCGLSLIGALALASAPVLAKEDPKVAEEVMALARAQWAAEIAQKGAAEQLATLADDYTEFNSDYPNLLVGKALALRMASAPQSGVSVVSEMQNARVQVYGDTAILTYNFVGVGKGSDGKISPNTAKSTRVYAKQDGKWMLVHANFAPVNAAP